MEVHNQFIRFNTEKSQIRDNHLIHEELPVLKRDFEKILLEAVDEGVSSLGESLKEAIYFHLGKNFNIKKHEIPDKIEAFTDAVENIFGFGANFLEIAIIRQLHAKASQRAKWHVSLARAEENLVAALHDQSEMNGIWLADMQACRGGSRGQRLCREHGWSGHNFQVDTSDQTQVRRGR